MGSSKQAENGPGSKVTPREIELKLEIASGDGRRLLEHPLMAGATSLPEQGGHLHAVYYDTPDLALRRSGLTLRIRRRNGSHVQTIKAEDGARGLALDRSEWEHPVDGTLDFDAAAGTPLAPLVADEAARAAIQPVFTIETQRHALHIEREDAAIELALDDATASIDGRTTHFAEVELELKTGKPSALFAVARDLAKAVPLRLTPVTKSERGYGLLDDASPEPVHATKIRIAPDASCAEAFQIIARSCLTQMIANEAVLRRTQDPEAVHQMRVGLRRLRAAISLFGSMLADGQSRAVKDELRWIGQQLGPARDLDVLIEGLSASTGSRSSEGGTEEAERRRRQAYDTLLEELESSRFMQAILETAAWIEAGDWLDGEQTSRPVRKHAAKELARRHRSILRQARHLEGLGDEERHRLRIRIKKLRYGAEFFAALFRDDRSKRRRKTMVAILGRLQDLLGEMNDIAVGGTLVPALAERDPEQARQRMRKLLSKAVAASARLSAAQPFWR